MEEKLQGLGEETVKKTTDTVIFNLALYHNENGGPMSDMLNADDVALVMEVVAKLKDDPDKVKAVAEIYDNVAKVFYEKGVRDAVKAVVGGRGISKHEIRSILDRGGIVKIQSR